MKLKYKFGFKNVAFSTPFLPFLMTHGLILGSNLADELIRMWV